MIRNSLLALVLMFLFAVMISENAWFPIPNVLALFAISLMALWGWDRERRV